MFSPIALFLFPLRLIARPGVDVRSAHAETELRHNFSVFTSTLLPVTRAFRCYGRLQWRGQLYVVMVNEAVVLGRGVWYGGDAAASACCLSFDSSCDPLRAEEVQQGAVKQCTEWG